jgi:RHS repeat-associated protein
VDNNGNLRKQETLIPNNEQNTSSTSWYQQYEYDSLNRLQRVHEYTGNPVVDWQQEYVYDRYGNRTIHQANTNTWGAGINKKDFTANTANNNRLGVPSGQTGTMTYDNAGNLTTDTYSGAAVTRAYDAENRMTTETQASNFVAGVYTYNADGQRARRKVSGVETWQVYGMEGELLAEYSAGAAVGSPQKEYGYRNGQLLITAEAGSGSVAPVFNDDFNDNLLDANKWTVNYPGGSPSVIEQSQQLQITLAPNTAGYNGVDSLSTYDLTGRMVQVEVAQGVSQAGWVENFLSLDLDANNSFLIDVGSSSLVFRSRVNGVNDQTVLSYSPTSHRHWRIRHDQSTNTINFETSADAAVWTTCKTVTPGFALTSLRLRLGAGAWGTGNGSPGAAKYDNFKLLASTAGSSSVTVANFGFETPVVGAGSFQYGPTGGTWTFASGAGVTGNNSGFTGGTVAPQGSQAAFLQGTGSYFSQSISGFQSGTNYIITFAAAQRSNCCNAGGQDFQVYLDTNLLGTFHPASGSYADYSTPTFTTTAGAHTVKFVGLNPLGGDHTAFVDNVRILGSSVPGFGTEWLVADQLGTPRMVFDKTGSLATTKRHDYLPFGEELSAGQGARSTTLGYGAADGVRQKFTSKERDNETGLDYFLARYYSSTQGRFTSSDPILMAEQKLFDPQQWNMYSYARNNPTVLLDPTGKYVCSDGKRCEQFEKARQEALKSKDANTVRGAKAYGDLSTKKGDKGDNGVYVGFADNLKDDRAGSVSRRDTGLELDSNSPNGLRATLNVTIQNDQAGNEEVVAHEGSHVADYQDFVKALGSDGTVDARADALNITHRQTETRAYLVSIGYAQRGNQTLNFGPCGMTKECKFPPGMMPALRDQQIQDLLNSQYKNLDTRLWPEPAYKVTKP